MNVDELANVSLPELRHLLAEARTRLRAHTDRLKVAEAQAEADEIAAKGGDEKALGSNEAARKRALIIALDERPAYRAVVWEVRRNEQEAEQLAAEIEGRLDGIRDARRERELAVRDKLTDAADRTIEARAAGVLR